MTDSRLPLGSYPPGCGLNTREQTSSPGIKRPLPSPSLCPCGERKGQITSARERRWNTNVRTGLEKNSGWIRFPFLSETPAESIRLSSPGVIIPFSSFLLMAVIQRWTLLLPFLLFLVHRSPLIALGLELLSYPFLSSFPDPMDTAYNPFPDLIHDSIFSFLWESWVLMVR